MAHKKATSNELLRRIEENRNRRRGEHNIYSDFLKMELPVRMIPIAEFLEIISNIDPQDFSQQIEAYKHLIYNHCYMLHNKDFQSDDYAEPYDVVLDVFGNDVQAIADFGEKISALYGLAEIKDEIKN